MLQPNQNTGVLEQLPGADDYIQDQASAISYEEVNPSGDWTSFLPLGELQIGVYGDTMACVTFSALNCLEAELRQKGIDKNFSDRFTAKMSGTTKNGNYLQAVANSIRHDGLVNESDWGWDPRSTNPKFDWDEFYKDIPDSVKSLGASFISGYEVQYEWVPTDLASLKKALKQAPIQIVTKVCPGWNDSPVKGCGFGSGHATTLYKIDDEGFHIFDHYEPYRKVLSPDYVIAYAMKYIIKPKVAPKPMLQKGKGGLVRNTQNGGYGLNLGDVILDTDSKDRTALLALDILMRKGYGVGLTDAEWNSVPHKPF